MKYLKKIITLFILIFAVMAFSACGEKTPDADKVSLEEVASGLLQDVENKTQVTEDITLPTEINGVKITWSSSNEAVISKEGKVTRSDKKIIVTLTATLEYKGETFTQDFKLQVLPKEEQEPVEVEISCARANEIGSMLAADETTTESYTVGGVIVEISNTVYGNLYISDDNGVTRFYVYGVFDQSGNRYDAMTNKPEVGDTIFVHGSITNYKGNTVEMKNATLLKHEKGENSSGGGSQDKPDIPEQGDFTGELATDLFISEYYEGSSGQNKYLEIYNGTGADVDLTNYSIYLYSNGKTAADSKYGILNLSGTLKHNSVCVVYHAQASVEAILAAGTIAATVGVSFNGNDAVALVKNGSVIDVFGVIGEDPGESWAVGSGSTKDNAIIRNSNIGYPCATWDATQWIVVGTDDTSNIGVHAMNFNGEVVEQPGNGEGNNQGDGEGGETSKPEPDKVTFESFANSSFITTTKGSKEVPNGWSISVEKGAYDITFYQSFRKNGEYIATDKFEAQSSIKIEFDYYLNNYQNDPSKTSAILFEALNANGDVIASWQSENLNINETGVQKAKTISCELTAEGIVSVKISFAKSGGGNIGFSAVRITK